MHELVSSCCQAVSHLAEPLVQRANRVGLLRKLSQQGADALIVEPESGSSIVLLNQNAALLAASDFYF